MKTKALLLYGGLGLAIMGYINRLKIADMGARLSSKWTRLHPEVKKRALQVLESSQRVFADTGYSVHIFDGWRDLKQQEKYISGGTSFVNNALKSYHPWGLAVDFVFKDKDGNWTWKPGADCEWYDLTCHGADWYWNELGKLIEAAGFEWGGRWQSFDGPHAQWTGEGRTSELIAQYGDPDTVRWG